MTASIIPGKKIDDNSRTGASDGNAVLCVSFENIEVGRPLLRCRPTSTEYAWQTEFAAVSGYLLPRSLATIGAGCVLVSVGSASWTFRVGATGALLDSVTNG